MPISTAVIPAPNVFDDLKLFNAVTALQNDHIALPLVKNNPRKWAVMGDSISAQGGVVSDPAVKQPIRGYLTWLTALSGQRINIEPVNNFSLSGITSAQVVSTYLPQALAWNPDIAIVEIGTNDPGGSITGDQTIANLTTIYTSLLQQNCMVVAILITPRSDGSATTAWQQQFGYVNRWIRRFAATNGRIICVDMRQQSALVDPTSGLPASGVTQDNLHPNAKGSYYFGTQIWSQVKQFVEQNDTHFWNDMTDTYDATYNPTGNMLTNGMFTTTSGGSITSNTQSALTGTIPGSFTASFTGSGSAYTGTCAYSTNVSRGDNLQGKLVQVAASSFTGTGGGANDKVLLFQQINFPTGLNVGDVVEGSCYLDISATSGLAGFDLNVGQTDGNGVTTVSTFAGPYTNSSGVYQGAYTLVLKTPKIVIGPTNGVTQRVLQLYGNLYTDCSASGPATFTAKWGNFCLRKVIV